MKQFIGKVLDKLTEAIYLLVVFLLPLYFAVFLKTNNVFELNKIILFKVLVLLFSLLTISRLIFGRIDITGAAVKFRQNKFLFIPFLFILVLVVASLFSVNHDLSIYGSYSRQLGLSSYSYFFLFFILLLININSKEQITRIIKTGVSASLVVSIYGLVQATGHDPLLWSESTELRTTSTFGQPNLLAMYLLLAIPISLYLFIAAKKLLAKLLYLFILLANLLCLFFTYSLSGWAGLIGGVSISGLIYFILSPPLQRRARGLKNDTKRANPLNPSFEGGQLPLSPLKKRGAGGLKKVIIILFALATFATLIIIVAKVQNKWVFQARVPSLVNLQSGSLASRFNFWKASWQAILKKPLLGYGPETQSEVLVGYYQKDWGVHENVNVRPDRAHNLFLDILLTTGIVGLVAYSVLLLLFFKLLFRIIKNKPEFKILAYCLLFALISYLIALQLNFTFIVSEVYFWLYLALVFILCHSRESGNPGLNRTNLPVDPKPEGSSIWPNTGFPIAFGFGNDIKRRPIFEGIIQIMKLIVIFIITSAVFYLINNQIKLLTADYYFRELRVARENNEYFAAIKMYEFIKKNLPAYGYYDRQFAFIMSDWLESFTNTKFKTFGEEKLATILKNSQGKSYDDLFARAITYKTLATSSQSDYFNLSEENFKSVIKISPEMPVNYIQLAGLYAKYGENKEAIVTYETAISKLPDLNNPVINSDHKKAVINIMYNIYLEMGDVYIEEKDYKKAEQYYEQAIDLDKNTVTAYGKLADLNFKINDFDQAIWYNEKAMVVDPSNYLWPANLAEINKKLGDLAKAKEYEQKAGLLRRKIWP